MENSEGRDFKIKEEKKKAQNPRKKLLAAEESGCKLGHYCKSHCDKTCKRLILKDFNFQHSWFLLSLI